MKTWLKGEIELFWLDKVYAERKHCSQISIDYIKWIHNDTALIKLQGTLPDSLDFFRNFKIGDKLALLYIEYGPREEYDDGQVIMTFDVNEIKRKWMFNPVVTNSANETPLNFYMKIECQYEKI